MNEYRIEEAASRREQQEAQLFRPDGSKVYGEQEHKERLQAIRAEHAAAFDRIDDDVARKVDEAEERLLLAENADLASTLDTDELQRVSALSGFVADDVERLSVADLVKRCKAASLTRDRPTLFLLAHYASRRVGESLSLSDEEGDEEVREVVAELRRKLDATYEGKVAAAREAVEEAQALREKAYHGRRGAKDAFDLYAQSGYWTGAAS